MSTLIWRCRRCNGEGTCEIKSNDFPSPLHQCDPNKPTELGFMERVGLVSEDGKPTQYVVNCTERQPVPVLKA